MNNRLVIKVCGMKDVANRQALEKMSVDIFGFIFYPASPRHVGDLGHRERYALTLTQKSKAGVFVDSSVFDVLEIAWKYSLDYIQLHGHESHQFCREIRSSGLKVIKVFKIDEMFDFSEVTPFMEVSDFFLFDTKTGKPGGSGKKFDWLILEKYQYPVPFLLGGGVLPQDAETLSRFNHPALYGVDLNSGFEVEPGIKNPAKIQSFLDKLNCCEA